MKKFMGYYPPYDEDNPNEWVTEWPMKEGIYWFYGYRYSLRTTPPELFLGRVRKISNGFIHSIEGHLVFETDGTFGLWKKANLPKLPEFPKEV